MSGQSTLPIKGSSREADPEAKIIGPSNPDQQISVSVYARRDPKPNAGLLRRIEGLASELPGRRQYFTDQEFAAVYGADPSEIDKISAWAETNNLTVQEKNAVQRRVKVKGTIKDISSAFGITLNEYHHPLKGNFRGRVGNIYVPADLFNIVEGVFGLDTRHVGEPYRRPSRFSAIKWQAKADASKPPTNPFPGSFYPPQVASLYNYPAGTDGTGQNVAIFAFNGGGSPDPHGGYSLAALQNYYEKVLGLQTPVIQDVVIQGPGNDPGADTEASGNLGDSTGEVLLDICVVGSIAPGAKIFMYFTEFTSQGWVDALHDAIAGTNDISVISISYGNPEIGGSRHTVWTDMMISQVNQAFEASLAKGITICISSGDHGSNDFSLKIADVSFPASSPNVLAIGGTKLVASANGNVIAGETVWNEMRNPQGNFGATGGGISAIFSKPVYQDSANVPPSVNPPHSIGRGVPDVAAIADPVTGVVIINIDGQHIQPIGGTSAAAPVWSSLILRLNQALGTRCGFLNTVLYTKLAANVLNDITVGNNGSYAAAPGWDACTGFGSPNGEKLLDSLK